MKDFYIDKQVLCVMTFVDRVRAYLYYTERSCSTKELLLVLNKDDKVECLDVYQHLVRDIRRGYIARSEPSQFKLTKKGRKFCERKQTLRCLIRWEQKE